MNLYEYNPPKRCRECYKNEVAKGRRFYCSEKCAKDYESTLRKKRDVLKYNLKLTAKRWAVATKNYSGDVLQRPAWPHRFGDKLTCQYCNLSWASYQVKKSQCTNPHRWTKIEMKEVKPRSKKSQTQETIES